jgi:hypothetical protein
MSKDRLKEWHRAWLAHRIDRTEDWLLAMMDQGFHIHHIDEDRKNNHPSNLILIEGGDHMRLHGMGYVRVGWRLKKPKYRVKAITVRTGPKPLPNNPSMMDSIPPKDFASLFVS